jgi:hypothetical protein
MVAEMEKTVSSDVKHVDDTGLSGDAEFVENYPEEHRKKLLRNIDMRLLPVLPLSTVGAPRVPRQ